MPDFDFCNFLVLDELHESISALSGSMVLAAGLYATLVVFAASILPVGVGILTGRFGRGGFSSALFLK